MEVKKIVVGPLEANCYVLVKDGNCLIIDPGADYMMIKDAIGDNKVLGVLITHSHFDHIGALRHFLTKRSIKIFKKSNLEDNKEYTVDNFKFKSLMFPGHSKDSVAFFFEDENKMFVGDFIFQGSIGRCDLPGGDMKEMKESLEKIKEYNEDIEIYPGHYDNTTLKDELEKNLYLQ